MIEQMLEFATIGKYVLAIVGVIGAIMLIYGVCKGERANIQRGGYLLIFAIVLCLSAYFIFKISEERTTNKMYEMQDQYGY